MPLDRNVGSGPPAFTGPSSSGVRKPSFPSSVAGPSRGLTPSSAFTFKKPALFVVKSSTRLIPDHCETRQQNEKPPARGDANSSSSRGAGDTNNHSQLASLHRSASSVVLPPSLPGGSKPALKPARRLLARRESKSSVAPQRYSPSPPKRLPRSSSGTANLLRASIATRSSSLINHPNITLRRGNSHSRMSTSASTTTLLLPVVHLPQQPSFLPTPSSSLQPSNDNPAPKSLDASTTIRKHFSSSAISSTAREVPTSPKKGLCRVSSHTALPPRSFFLKPPAAKKARMESMLEETEIERAENFVAEQPFGPVQEVQQRDETEKNEDSKQDTEESGYLTQSSSEEDSPLNDVAESCDERQAAAVLGSISIALEGTKEEEDEENEGVEHLVSTPLPTALSSWPRRSALKKPTNFRELYMRLAEADASGTPRSSLRKVNFRTVDVFLFQRAQGFTTVPDMGEIALGMRKRHFDVRQVCLSTGSSLGREGVYEPVSPEGDDPTVLPESPLKPNIPVTPSKKSSSSQQLRSPSTQEELTLDEEEEVEEGEDIGWTGQLRVGDAPILPYPAQQRVLMLRKCGVTIKKVEGPRCKELRLTRRQCGCTCADGICRPESCECAINEIQCQDDQQGIPYPCACYAQSCQNPNGRVAFSPQRVRQHHLTTMQRLRDQRKSSNFDSPQHTVFTDDNEDEETKEDTFHDAQETISTSPVKMEFGAEATSTVFIGPVIPNTPTVTTVKGDEETTPVVPNSAFETPPQSTPTTLPGEGKRSLFPVTPTYNKLGGKRVRLNSRSVSEEEGAPDVVGSPQKARLPVVSEETPTRVIGKTANSP